MPFGMEFDNDDCDRGYPCAAPTLPAHGLDLVHGLRPSSGLGVNHTWRCGCGIALLIEEHGADWLAHLARHMVCGRKEELLTRAERWAESRAPQL